MRLTVNQKIAIGGGLALLALVWRQQQARAATPVAPTDPDCLLRFFGKCILRKPANGPEGSVTAETYFRRAGKCQWSRTWANGWVVTEPVNDARCADFEASF